MYASLQRATSIFKLQIMPSKKVSEGGNHDLRKQVNWLH